MTDQELKLTLAMGVLLLPLLAAVCIALGARRWRGLSAGLSLGASAIAFVCSLILFIKFHEYFSLTYALSTQNKNQTMAVI